MKQYFVVLIVFVTLLKASQGLVWPCKSNEECTSEESTCSNFGTCQCDFDHVFSLDYTKCLKTSLYSEKCEETGQCNLMPSGAKCNKGVCECNDGYTYVRGRCRLLNGLGNSCQTDIDCHFGYDRQSVMCKNKICECADGYYNRHGNICRRKSMAINDTCVVNTDCDELGSNVKCVNLVCASTSTNGDFPRNQREIAVQTSLESYELKPLNNFKRDISIENPASSTATGRITRDEEDKTLSTLSNTDDDVDEKKYGSSCTDNGNPCPGLAHSTCADNVCFCNQGYYAKNGKCFAELGEIAESVDECEFEFEEATKKCLCQKNYFYERSLRSCRKPIQYHLSCTSNSQCSPFGAVFCHPSIPRRCTCEEYAEYDEPSQLCVYKQGLGAQCETNDSCPIENSICSSEHVCKCKQNYIEDNGACAKGVGAECIDDSECLPTNTVCESTTESKSEKSKACQCRKGYVHFKDECLKQAVEPEDECVETEQCKPLLANCVDKKCVCGDKQHFSGGKCVDQKSLGEACTRAGECHLEKDPENIECRNSICQCKIGYQPSTTQRTCTHVGPKKNSSGRPSALKIITFMLIGSAFLITSAALKQAFY
ncbi:prion-like-(Q/N-rich) domain-bearing protein 25 isoform X1 [Eupeodes corollae]|uniref:prion-like-(Q/N-rich) domain-bearing protein 25 isoform X1 n=2 Tax=Eupeodes corollae TaxID=290404 RepID=UPI0024936878|nr:prion-like-(Q/N-rich) domain-bearing protein 25 isoform X1 [Eupeodes corollae]